MIKLCEKGLSMKKRVLIYTILSLMLVGVIATTVLSVYFFKNFKNASSFDTYNFIMMITFILLTLGIFIGMFIMFVKLLSLKGEKKDEKNS